MSSSLISSGSVAPLELDLLYSTVNSGVESREASSAFLFIAECSWGGSLCDLSLGLVGRGVLLGIGKAGGEGCRKVLIDGCLYVLSEDFLARFLPLVGEVDLGLLGEASPLPLPSWSTGRLWLEVGLDEGGLGPVEAIHGVKLASRLDAKALLRLLSMSMPQVTLLEADVGPVFSVPAMIEDAIEESSVLGPACPESSLDAGSKVMEGLGIV